MPDQTGLHSGGDSVYFRANTLRVRRGVPTKSEIMNREKFQQLIRSIFAVKEQEMLSSEFFDILPRFVDLQVAGERRGQAFPRYKPPSPAVS